MYFNILLSSLLYVESKEFFCFSGITGIMRMKKTLYIKYAFLLMLCVKSAISADESADDSNQVGSGQAQRDKDEKAFVTAKIKDLAEKQRQIAKLEVQIDGAVDAITNEVIQYQKGAPIPSPTASLPLVISADPVPSARPGAERGGAVGVGGTRPVASVAAPVQAARAEAGIGAARRAIDPLQSRLVRGGSGADDAAWHLLRAVEASPSLRPCTNM